MVRYQDQILGNLKPEILFLTQNLNLYRLHLSNHLVSLIMFQPCEIRALHSLLLNFRVCSFLVVLVCHLATLSISSFSVSYFSHANHVACMPPALFVIGLNKAPKYKMNLVSVFNQFFRCCFLCLVGYWSTFKIA